MLKNLPVEIIEYLVSELPPFTGVLIIRSNNEGNIIDYHGPYNKYLNEEPVIGQKLHEHTHVLYSMVPVQISPMVLENVQLKNTVFADIHIVDLKNDEHWVFFVDQTNHVDGISDIIQKINEEKYNNESRKAFDSLNPYDVFDDLILEIETDNNAITRSCIPNWFKQLSPGIISNTSIIFTEIFPFLEVFIIEANDFWIKKENGKFTSGIWIESIPNDDDLALTAIAIYINTKKFILIRPIDKTINHEQLGFQMAREQKLAYEKLEKTEKQLKTLLNYKDKFVSIVSHDLRSPVAAVLGISEMLINDKKELAKLNKIYRDLIYNIKDELVRLLDYNDKLYHWSNLELGNFEIVLKKVNLKDIINNAQRTSQLQLDQKEIEFSTNLTKDIFIKVDLTLFLQVLNNLISNAIKFTPKKGKININVFKQKDKIEIIVSDLGVGIPKDIAENIFNDSSRHSTMGTSGEKGTGLGLGIVKKILDAHNFGIRIESEVGKGSDFIISIPKK